MTGAVAWWKRAGLLKTEGVPFFLGRRGGEVFGEGGQLGRGLISDAGFEASGYGDPMKETGIVVRESGGELFDIAEGDPELGKEEVDAAEGGGATPTTVKGRPESVLICRGCRGRRRIDVARDDS